MVPLRRPSRCWRRKLPSSPGRNQSQGIVEGIVTNKLFSTFACTCVDEKGDSAKECDDSCYPWQRLDLEETLRDWVAANPSRWFGISNLSVVQEDGSKTRDSGYVRCDAVEDLVDFLVLASYSFSIDYGVPSGDEWHFSQLSLLSGEEPDDWQSCKVFYTISRD